jgi:subtilisin family serine protease
VGNHGPAAEPRYPAAYPGVIGATAVDSDQRIYRYANHGAHVDFAALGVDLPVADAAGGWRTDSGTSMAAPEVTVIAAGVRQGGYPGGANLGAALAVMARDLGPEGFDTTFGHGLLESATPETAVRILSQD